MSITTFLFYCYHFEWNLFERMIFFPRANVRTLFNLAILWIWSTYVIRLTLLLAVLPLCFQHQRCSLHLTTGLRGKQCERLWFEDHVRFSVVYVQVHHNFQSGTDSPVWANFELTFPLLPFSFVYLMPERKAYQIFKNFNTLDFFLFLFESKAVHLFYIYLIHIFSVHLGFHVPFWSMIFGGKTVALQMRFCTKSKRWRIFVRKCTCVCLFASIFLNFHFLPVQVYPNETASAEFPLRVDHADLLFHWFSEGPYGASHPSTRSEPNSSINIKMCIILLFWGEKECCALTMDLAFNEFGYYEHPTLMSKFFRQERTFLVDINVWI